MNPIPPEKKFRRNVCAVLTDATREQVLVFQRVEPTLGLYCWQFPQGGLEPGEEPEEGLYRELREEIGTDSITLLARAERPIRYEFPPELLAELAKGKPTLAGYGGQEQYWFLGCLTGGAEQIHFRHQPAEFNAYRWVSPREAVDLVVPFKKEAYRQGLKTLGMLPSAQRPNREPERG